MTTYQHGQQPDGAPVTWRTSQSGLAYIVSGKTVELYMDCDSHDDGEMEDICRAFHVAKLAEEARGCLDQLKASHNGGMAIPVEGMDYINEVRFRAFCAAFDAAKGSQ